jgi:hypothetical protein
MYIEFGREYLGKVGINHESTRLILTSSFLFFIFSFFQILQCYGQALLTWALGADAGREVGSRFSK